MGCGLRHELDTTAPPPPLDEPDETDFLQLTDVVAQALTRQAQALGQRAGGGRLPKCGQDGRTRRLQSGSGGSGGSGG